VSGAKRQQASKKEKNQKGVRGLLASMKDVFTPRRKWNPYRKEWNGWERSRRLRPSCRRRNSRMNLREDMRRSVRMSFGGNAINEG
jgi:hypothetical protein